MVQAIVTGALVGALIAGCIGGAVKETREKDVYTFGNPAAIVGMEEKLP